MNCAPICCEFVESTNFSLNRTNGQAEWSALQFVKITYFLLPKTTKSVMLRNEKAPQKSVFILLQEQISLWQKDDSRERLC